MKKLFSILIALALLVGVSVPAFALEGTISYGTNISLGSLRTIVIENNTSSHVTTPVLTANSTHLVSGVTEPGVIPGKAKILGYDFAVIGPGTAAATVALVDAPAWTSGGGGDIFSEAEATSSVPYSKIFPAGMGIRYQLYVEQGPYSVVTIYYIQDVA